MSAAEPGTVLFDRYRVVRRIAAGGMGTVFEARDLVLDQPVALKRVSYAALPDELAAETRERTLREARNAAQLRGDPHVVAIYDVQLSDPDVWLVLEYLPSLSLAELTAGRARLDVRTVSGIGATVARGLAAAHARGITHRDVKPGNILIATEGGTAKLTDFGISHAEGESTLTATGQVSGTPAYMAREVARGEDATPASDVFSLGATLYAAVEGTGPFGSQSNPRAMVYRVANDPVRPPEVSGALGPVLMAMLADEPTTRPGAATVAEWLDALATQPDAPVLRGRGPAAPPWGGSGPQPPRAHPTTPPPGSPRAHPATPPPTPGPQPAARVGGNRPGPVTPRPGAGQPGRGGWPTGQHAPAPARRPEPSPPGGTRAFPPSGGATAAIPGGSGSRSAGPNGAGPHGAGPHGAGPHGAGPHGADPGSGGPGGAGPGSAGPNGGRPGGAGPGAAGPGIAGPNGAGPTVGGGPGSGGPGPAGSGAALPGGAGPGRAGVGIAAARGVAASGSSAPGAPVRRRPALLAGGAVAAVLVVVAAVVGLRSLTTTPDAAPPPVASPRAITGDPRAADPCLLLDLTALQRFGSVARSAGSSPSGCRADITPSDGRPAQITASFNRGITVDGGTQQMGDLVVQRGRTDAGAGSDARRCQHNIVLPDGNQVLLWAYSFSTGIPPCDLADAALDSAVASLQRDGVRYDPQRNADVVLAGADACQSLDPAALGRAGIGVQAFPGFASWSCSWGSAQNYASVSFGGTTERTGIAGDPAPPVAGRKAYVQAGPGSCSVTVEHRAGPGPDDRVETVTTTVAGTAADRACPVATDLAADAESRLPA